MKRTFAAATIAMSLTAGALAPAASAQTSQFLDEGRTVFDDAQCPSTAKSENEFLGKKQSIFDKCTKQEKKPKEKPSSTSEAAKPSEEAETTAPSEPSEKPAPEKQDPAKPAKKSPWAILIRKSSRSRCRVPSRGTRPCSRWSRA